MEVEDEPELMMMEEKSNCMPMMARASHKEELDSDYDEEEDMDDCFEDDMYDL